MHVLILDIPRSLVKRLANTSSKLRYGVFQHHPHPNHAGSFVNPSVLMFYGFLQVMLTAAGDAESSM